jgi:hypothetical protein
MASPHRYLSIADIARRLDVPRHRVLWVVDTYSVRPAATIGECRGYTEASVKTVREHLDRIDSSRLAAL